MSLYEEIGGEASIDAALDKFYPRILGDPRVSFLFEGTDMARLRKHAPSGSQSTRARSSSPHRERTRSSPELR